MAEEQQEVKTYEVNYRCDNCGIGYMIGSKTVALMSYPARFPHKCTHCGHTTTFTKCYPLIQYEVSTFSTQKG